MSEPFSPAKNTLEHNCDRLGVAHPCCSIQKSKDISTAVAVLPDKHRYSDQVTAVKRADCVLFCRRSDPNRAEVAGMVMAALAFCNPARMLFDGAVTWRSYSTFPYHPAIQT
jgi:hypothetical protein